MRPVTQVEGIAAALVRDNIDTDQIIPKQFLKTVGREGLGRGLFCDDRFGEDGVERTGFVLNRLVGQDCRVLVAGGNFGCGSSREHAVWALLDHGIEAVVAPGFADNFKGNAVDNGLLLAVVQGADHAALVAAAKAGARFRIDLNRQEVTAAAVICGFDIAPGHRERLLMGRDKIDETLDHAEAVRAMEVRLEAAMPWLRRREPAGMEDGGR